MYEPKNLHGKYDIIKWRAHPLSNTNGYVSLNKLDVWQEAGYREDFVETIKELRCGGGCNLRAALYKRPRSFRTSPRDGYVMVDWVEHPLARGRNRFREHLLVYWQEHGYSDDVLAMLLSSEHQVHHRDGNRSNNEPSNLMLLTRCEHHQGVSEDDMVYTLEALGYTVHPPLP